MGGEKFTLPAGCYADIPELGFKDVMMALPTTIDKTGVHYTTPTGTKEEMADLQKSWMSRLGEDCIFTSARERLNIEALKYLLYARVKQLHVQKYPYNDFLFDHYEE